jgi:hypothetical protein
MLKGVSALSRHHPGSVLMPQPVLATLSQLQNDGVNAIKAALQLRHLNTRQLLCVPVICNDNGLQSVMTALEPITSGRSS